MVLRFTVALVAVGLLLVVANVFSMNPLERLIFVPDSVLVGTPKQWGLDYEDVEFSTADGVRLHGWYVPGTRPETLLWFHGNAGNISHRLDNLRLLHDQVGTAVFLFDYRGYGRSEGQPSERGLYEDARAALQHFVTRRGVPREDLIYFGRSLGSGVAIELATEATPRGLILETPFVSIRAMARSLFGPLAVVAPSSFDNLSKSPRLKCPKLFIHGDSDSLVPYAQGRELFEAALPPKAFYTIRGADHNDTYLVGGSTYFRRIREFIEGLSDRSSSSSGERSAG
jgi:fermentation-respiration switch protein FrsA (DUF1100 family)